METFLCGHSLLLMRRNCSSRHEYRNCSYILHAILVLILTTLNAGRNFLFENMASVVKEVIIMATCLDDCLTSFLTEGLLCFRYFRLLEELGAEKCR